MTEHKAVYPIANLRFKVEREVPHQWALKPSASLKKTIDRQHNDSGHNYLELSQDRNTNCVIGYYIYMFNKILYKKMCFVK